MLNFYSSCFDRDTDSTNASVASFNLPLKTGWQHEGIPISKFFVEGVLLFAANQCASFGFVEGSNESKIGATWKVPGGPSTLFWGMLDLKTGFFSTNAMNNFARQGFGLLGMGVALKSGDSNFRAAWMNFLNELSEKDVTAVNEQTMGWLAATVGEALRNAVPATHTGDTFWLLNQSGDQTPQQNDPPFKVADIRGHFVSPDSFMALINAFDAPPEFETRFQGPQLATVRNLLKRRKHTILLGPPGVGKTISAFEALALEGYETAGVDYQLFSGHDEVKSADFLGSWQPNGEPGKYVWVNGCLVRAMTANGGHGQPILVEEFTRMPTRAQNMFISALSDGYVVLNEKPTEKGEGEVVRAGPGFVLLADMNVDPSADDIELYGAAFSSRVRKVEYEYPSVPSLMQILEHDVPETTKAIRAGVAGVFDATMKRWTAAEVGQPISPRACVQWAEEIIALTDERKRGDASMVRAAAWRGAELTWLRDVAGTDAKMRKQLMADVEAQFRKSFQLSKAKATS